LSSRSSWKLQCNPSPSLCCNCDSGQMGQSDLTACFTYHLPFAFPYHSSMSDKHVRSLKVKIMFIS
jgi:hypothetical protein